jgi:hypothetical protein
VLRRIEREPSEPVPPTEPAPAPRAPEPKVGAQTLIGGTAPVVTASTTSPAPSGEGEPTSGVLLPAEPAPVQWPTVDEERAREREELAPRSQPEPEELHDQFFSAGEEGMYDGGPASLIPEASSLEFEHEALDTIPALRPRTPAQEKRRRRFVLGVAGVIGFGLAVSGWAIFWNAGRTREPEPPLVSEPSLPAAPEPGRPASEPLIPAPPSGAEAPSGEPDLPTMAMPEGAPEPARPPAGVGVASPAGPPPGFGPGPMSGHPPASAPGSTGPSAPSRPTNPVTGRPPTAAFPIEPP